MESEGGDHVFRRINLFIKERLQTLRKTTPSELFFLKHKFRTGTIRLNELGVEAELNPNQFYKFEWAENVFEHEEGICREYNCGSPKFAHSAYSNLNGLCIPLTKKISETRSYANIVVVRRNLKQPTDIYTLGHEDGHFLWFMNLKHLVYQQYDVPGYIRDKITDNEDFAMFCGNIAMANAGYNLSRIRTETQDPLLLVRDTKARDRAIEVIPEQFYSRLFNRDTPKGR
jgi:hypothetical protein